MNLPFSKRIPELVLILIGAGAIFYAFDRWDAMRQSRVELEARAQDLTEIKKILAERPELLESVPVKAGNTSIPGSTTKAVVGNAPADLKPLVQQACARQGVRLLYLADSEKDAGKGVRERDVLTRLADVNHGALVRFLAELEARGDGAKIKELRAHPSKENSEIYKDAEVVLAQRWAVEPKAAGKERAE